MYENGGGTWQVRNSIFSDNELGFTGTGFTHGYNVYDELNYPTVSGGDGNQVADPLFTDRDNDDYTLGDGSPAIDMGSNPAGLSFDQRGGPHLFGQLVHFCGQLVLRGR